MERIERIVAMGGSFNPPTVAHQKLMLAAMDEVYADRGVYIPTGDEYLKRKMEERGRGGDVLPAQLRLEMCRAMARDDARLWVDDAECRGASGKSFKTLSIIRKDHPGAELYFLVGSDKLEVISHWYKFLKRFCIIIVSREGAELEAEIEKYPLLVEMRNRIVLLEVPENVEGVSSSAVREALQSGKSAGEMLHPAVEYMLKESNIWT